MFSLSSLTEAHQQATKMINRPARIQNVRKEVEFFLVSIIWRAALQKMVQRSS